MPEQGEGRARGQVAGNARAAPVRDDTATGIDVGRRLAPGTLIASRYRIVALVGMGGMGIVYKARDEELSLDVALKVLRPDLGADPDLIERFRRELVLARQVTHRNVVRIHDIGESDGLRFLTMRFVEGRSLKEELDGSGPLNLPRALWVVRQLAEALQQAHEAGVVHRDLKPANVLLGEDDTAYVSDFGVARSLEGDGLTRAGAVVGTPDYLSPEQVCGDPVDGRSDIYALGIVFYEMLTGQRPFRADSRAESLAQRVTGHPRDITETGVRVPAWVRRIVRRCLERRPDRRYQGAGDLVRDLDRQSAGSGGLPRLGGRHAAVLALIVIAASWAGWRHRAGLPLMPSLAGRDSAATTAAPPRHAVAVLPLSDETQDPALSWTASGVAEMLTAQLAESPDLRVLDALRVVRTLRDLQLRNGNPDEHALKRLAGLLEVDSVVVGTVRKAAPTVRVDLRLVSFDAAGGAGTRHLGAETAEAGGVFRMVSRLAQQLRRELGSAAPTGAGETGPETTSLDAALAYRGGRDRLLVGDYVAAAPAFEKAVAADPAFAAALDGLSEAYQNLGYDDKAIEAAERASQALAAGGETRLRHRVRARLALLKNDPAGAEKAYAELAKRYPHDTEALLDLASAQAGRGEIAQAVETLKRATSLDHNDPRAWFLLGKNMILMGDATAAVSDALVRALALHGQLGSEQGQGDALNAMGVGYHQLGEHAHAIEKYSAAAEIRRHLKDERGVATSLRNRARTYQAMGRFDEAEPDLRSARAIYEKIGDRQGLADVLNEFGVLQEGRADYAAARKSYQEALKLRRDMGDERQLAQSYDNVGYIFFLEGEYDNALVYWRQALDLRRRIGEKGGVILSTQNMGFLQMAQGKWEEALKSFVEALEGSRAIDFKNAMAVSLGNIGVLHQYEGRYAAALQSFAEAIDLLRKLEDKRGLAEFTLKEAAALVDLGRLDAAKAKLDEAEPWIRETGNREQSSDLHLLLGAWHAQKGDKDAAGRAFSKAREEATASKSRTAILRARVAHAASVPSTHAAMEVADSVKEAEALGDALLRIRAAETMSRLELARGRLPVAEDSARRALKLATTCGWEAGLFRLHALLGRVLEKKGDAAGASREYAAAAARVAKLRQGLDGDLRAGFDSLDSVREVQAWAAGHAGPQPASRRAENPAGPRP